MIDEWGLAQRCRCYSGAVIMGAVNELLSRRGLFWLEVLALAPSLPICRVHKFLR